MLNIEEKVFITIDVDWASEEVLQYTIELLKSERVPATIMVTHESPILDIIKADPLFDLGIHPNFNKMLDGKSSKAIDYKTIINEMRVLIPEAKCVRSHSLVCGTKILNTIEECGFTHDVNIYVPAYNRIKLIPFYCNKIIRVPFFWEDDLFCREVNENYNNEWDSDFFLDCGGIKVFNFHPIHIFLNSEDMDKYEESREHHYNYDKLKEYCNNGNTGTKRFLLDMISKVKSRGMKFGLIKEVCP